MNAIVGAIWESATGAVCTLLMQEMITTYDPATMMDVVTMGEVTNGEVFTDDSAITMCCAQDENAPASVQNPENDLSFPTVCFI